jgi:TPP-dependent pyruvate/acetoin dehydrogenase alpha subunit
MTKSSAAVADATADAAALGDRYAAMVRIRRFEEAIQRLFLKGEVHGTVHLCNGQEAVAVGVCSALEDRDVVSATYRGHGVALALGTTERALAAELMGRATGVCKGRSGSLNVVDREHRLLHCSGIIGGSIACATGAALSARRTGGVSAAFFGDGAVNQAYFHECLNFARVLELPLLLVCENNLYGEFTPMAQVTAGADIAARAAGYDLHAEKVDGNDVEAVRAAALAACERIRAGAGPQFLEMLTYRQLGHSKTDPGTYRPAEELAAWLERDPLLITRDRLIAAGVDEQEVDRLADAAAAAVAAAIDLALADPFPDPAEAIGALEYAA